MGGSLTGKHVGWRHAWRRQAPGVLAHPTGLRVLVSESADGSLDVEADPVSLQDYQAAETARGVPLHDLQARLMRLLREAANWHNRNP